MPSTATALARLRKYAVLFIVAGAGAATSVYVYQDLSRHERRATQEGLRLLAADRKERIEILIDRALSSTHAIAALFYVRGDVTRREFETFVHHGLKSHPEISRFQWQPKVRAAERERFEARARRDGLSGFRLLEPAGDGRMQPAKSRPLHFPVLYEAPLTADDNALGLDLAWDPQRLSSKYAARDTASAQASPILAIRRTTDRDPTRARDRLGFTISVPVYDRAPPPTLAERERALRGFVAAVISTDRLLAPALADLADKGVDVQVFARSTADATPQLFYRGQSPDSGLSRMAAGQADDVVASISLAGQHWHIVFHARPGSFTPGGTASLALVLGLLCTALLTAYLYSGLRRRAHIDGVNRRQQEALAALAVSEQRFRYLVEGLKVIAWELDLSTSRFTYVSPHAEAILGYPIEDWHEEGFLTAHLHPDDRGRNFMRSVLDAGKDPVLDYRMLGADGGVVWLKDVVSILEDAQGKPCALRGIMIDVTEKKKTEARLQEQLHFVHQLLDAIPNPVFFKDERGRYLGCNTAFAKTVGQSRESMLGKNVYDLWPHDLAEIYDLADRELLEHPGTQVFETSLRPAAGGVRDIVFYKATFFRTDGRLGGLVGVIHDITERKRAEQEQHALEAKLRQAQKMESIGHLSGGIAHDFNNILAAILGYAELARMAIEERSNTNLDTFIDEILQATHRAKDLVAQLLTFSRSDELAADTVIVAPIVREVVKLLRSTFPSTVSLSLEVGEELPDVRINPVQLHQVLMNLCINARDAVDGTGCIEIRVSSVRLETFANCKACHQDFQGSYLLLSVKDDGPGIRPQDLTKIFTPFFTTKEVGKGTGLGLSVLHGIVHSAGGHVDVISAPGRPTEFQIYLPAQPTTAKLVGGAARIARPAAGSAGRILLVDDEPPIIGSTTGLLENMGCEVTGLSDPEAALRLFSADPSRFDLVITDQTMPGLTGTELARAMLARRPELPIVLCTGFSKSVDAESARRAGIRSFLQKPVAAGRLMETVKRLLSTEAADETPERPRP